MDADTARHGREILQAAYNHIAVIGLVAGGIAGAVMWSVKQILSRYSTVTRMNEIVELNTSEHSRIERQMAANQAELLNTILDLHKNDNDSRG